MLREIYNKDNETVKQNTREAHAAYIAALEKFCEEADMNTSELSLGAGAGPAATYRVKNENENITLFTMQRFAHACGKKVVISFEDLDS